MFTYAKGSRGPLLLLAGIVLVFLKPLGELVQLARAEDMASHVLLIPFISYYLLSVGRRKESQDKTTAPVADEPGGEKGFSGRRIGLPLLVLGLALYGADLVLISGPAGGRLSGAILAFVMCVAGAYFSFLDRAEMARSLFPCAFLIFMVPMPVFLRNGLEIFFQHSSAEAANMLLALTGTPMLRDGLIFQIPGITIQVAQECSGIHSSFVLFMTSLLAGQLFLKSRWKRFWLAAFVIPLGIVRNGFRICVIAMLCVHVGPEMVHSPIHLRGGPIFFVLSLIPFFAFLIWLWRSERKKGVKQPVAVVGEN